mgnify:CR=1 FL=1|tara:strand:- start:6281 stop:8974 length:2694 start_codon:yes stop_codon:yes gene_type:complete
MNNKKLFIIDGMALIYRSYYAMIKNPLLSSSGLNTSAIYGFINSLFKLLKDEKPDYLSIVLDTKGKTFRHKMYDDYKATRKPMPEDLSEQIQPLYSIIEKLKIPMYKKEGFEADDIIGTMSEYYTGKNIDVYIYSSDKDLMQLVNDNVFVFSPGNSFVKSKIYNKEEVYSKWDVFPEQIIDYLSLLGDVSDNIPGVKGIGKKTASKLMHEFNNFENLYKNIDNVSNDRIKLKLLDSKNDAYLSKELITIDKNVDIEFSSEEMVIENFEFDKISEMLHDLDIFTFDKIIDTYNSTKNTETKKIDKKYKLINSKEDLKSFLVEISKQKYLAIDLETTNLDANIADIVGISFSFHSNEAFYIPFVYPSKKVDGFNKDYIINKLKPILELKDIKYIGQNIKYDSIVLRRNGILLSNIYFDTMIAESLISPEKNSYKLDVLSLDYLNYKMQSIEELIGTGKKQKNMNEVSLNEISFYACEDADITWQIYDKQRQIIENDFKDLFYNVEIPLINVIVEMEFNGVFVDMNIIKNLSTSLKEKLSDISESIFDISKFEFNLNSPKQLAEVLFDKLELKQIKKRSTSVQVLQVLKDYHPIIDLILEYRHLNKLVNTYLDTMPNYLNQNTNRIHTSFNQVVTSTGRLSSNKPNFQNIPIKTEIGKEIRKAFTVQEKDYYIISFDYSQIELRILAHFSNEINLRKAFIEDVDIHSKTASLIYGINISDVADYHRRVAKIINYSIVYGAGPFRISQELKISMKESKSIIQNYFDRYPGIKEYIQSTIEFGMKNDFVSTILGRKRNTVNLKSSNKNIVEAEKRATINMPIQGSASDLIKVAMIKIYNEFKRKSFKSKMILQIHDELLFEVHKSELDMIITVVKNEMESAIDFQVPIRVDYNYGLNWYEAH